MKRFLTLLLISVISLSIAFEASAQKKNGKPDREEWFRQMRQFRHDYLVKELDLTEQQQTKFFPVYDAMVTERRDARRKVRHAEKELKKKGNAATEAEYQQVAKMQYELKGIENDIEMKYYPQFKSILTTKQLYNLKGAEEKFSKQVRDYYHSQKHKKRH